MAGIGLIQRETRQLSRKTPGRTSSLYDERLSETERFSGNAVGAAR
jgi:hypothetical protein